MPTRHVVAGFGPVSADNRRVIVQEWLAEAFTMWGVAVMVIAAVGGGWSRSWMGGFTELVKGGRVSFLPGHGDGEQFFGGGKP